MHCNKLSICKEQCQGNLNNKYDLNRGYRFNLLCSYLGVRHILLCLLTIVFFSVVIRYIQNFPTAWWCSWISEPSIRDSFHENQFKPQELFHKLDLDDDGRLSFDEFLSFTKNYKVFSVEKEQEKISDGYLIQDIPIILFDEDDQVITLQAFLEPLLPDSLTKDVNSIPYDQQGSLQGLFQWLQPFKKWQNFAAKTFTILLPPKNNPLTPGSTWWVIHSVLDDYMGQMSSSRHYSPVVEPKLRPLFALLCMLHPHPFLWTRFAPQGTVALLRAVGDDFLDIVFRMHAEFQLNEPPLFPFWFTPAQFQGRLIISKDGASVQYFNLKVPTKRKLNVDMEWLNGPEEDSMEVDIGYVPRMEILSTGPSMHLNEENKTDIFISSPVNYESSLDAITWTEEITIEDALSLLDKTFNPFKEVEYYNMTEAFQRANVEKKLVHAVLLWGSLDDQSC